MALPLVYLLFKTWRARQRTLAFGSATQLTVAYLCRLSLSVFVYIVLAYGSFVPLAIYFLLLDGASPSIHPAVGISTTALHDGELHMARALPGVLSYFPAVLGIAFFLMYGFGSHARAAYRHFASRYLLCKLKRRNSAMPLMGSAGTAGLTPDLKTPSIMETFEEHQYPHGPHDGDSTEAGPPRRSI